MMRRYVGWKASLLAFIGFMLVGAVSSASDSAFPDVIRVGVQGASPPFSFINADGSRSGFDIDIAAALCAEIKRRCEWVESDFAGLIPGLKDHRFDMVVSSLSITPERSAEVDFTRSYYRSPARYVAESHTRLDFDDQGLLGQLVGVKKDTTFDRYLSDNYDAILKIRRYSTQDEALVDLVLGRLTLVMGDQIVLRENFLDRPVGKGYRFIGPEVEDRDWFGDGIGIAVQKGDHLLLNSLNDAIDRIRSIGIYDVIRRKYFDYDISGLTKESVKSNRAVGSGAGNQ